MSYSLPSRDLIADSIETVMGAQWYDALVTVPGCDKNMPGSVIAMARLNRPSLMVYGGTIRAGHRAREAARHHFGVPVVRRVSGRRRSPTNSGSTSCATPARAPAPAAACTPRTRWPWRSRRSDCRCHTVRRCPRRILARRRSAAVPERRCARCSNETSSRATSSRRKSFENAHDDDHGGRWLDQRGPAPAGDGESGERAAVARRLPARERSRAAPRRPEAQWPVRAGGSARSGRHTRGDEVPARARLPAWRCHDRHGEDAGREPCRCGAPHGRAVDDSAARDTGAAARPHPDPAWQPGARRRLWPRSQARKASASLVQRRSTTPRKRCSPASRRRRSPKARSS